MTSVTVNGVPLHYKLDGTNPAAPVVMLANSLASNLGMWKYQVPALTAAGFRVLRFDSRGHGTSGVPPGPYTIAQLTADALGLMDALGLEQVHFCGLSMGGMIGQRLATSDGDRLYTLALCATAAHMGPAEIWDQRIAAVAQGGMAAVAEATINRWFSAASQARIPEDIASIRDGILRTPAAGFAACCAAIRDMDQREAIAAITVPTLVLVGADDPSTPVSAAEFIHARIPGARLVVIPEAQHLFNVDRPAAFNEALLRFLRAAGG